MSKEESLVVNDKAVVSTEESNDGNNNDEAECKSAEPNSTAKSNEEDPAPVPAEAPSAPSDLINNAAVGDGSEEVPALEEAPALVNADSSTDNCAKAPSKEIEDDDAPKTFPQILMEILNDDENYDTVAWLPHGRSFLIYKKKKFAAQILPKYFKATKFTSFTRKLNRWGFTRVTRGPEMGSYYHKLFLRDDPSLCLRMSSHSNSKFQETQPHLMPAPMGHMPFGMPMAFGMGMQPMMPYGMTPGDINQQSQFINQQLQSLQWQQAQLQQLQQQNQQQGHAPPPYPPHVAPGQHPPPPHGQHGPPGHHGMPLPHHLGGHHHQGSAPPNMQQGPPPSGEEHHSSDSPTKL